MNAPRRMAGIPLWGLGLVCASLIAARVDPSAYEGGRARDDEDRLRRNSSAVAAMLGEFRTGMSDIMFIKTERYLHGGVAYRPHHDESVLSAGDLADEVEEHQSELSESLDDPARPHAPACSHGSLHPQTCPHGHASPHEHVCASEGAPTLIPGAEQDFRGFIGRLHREVKPWRDPSRPHLHTDGRELTPWFRLMTRTDPRYVRGYVAGAFWLQSLDPAAAVAFIDEGLHHNPDAFSLYVSRALITLRKIRQHDGVDDVLEASPADRGLLERALADFERAAELALAQRPAEVLETGDPWAAGWSAYLEDDAARACHMTVLLNHNLGRVERSRELGGRYLRHFPDYAPLRGAVFD